MKLAGHKVTPRMGFTLVELLVVVVIIGVMGTLGVSNFHQMRDSSNNASTAANVSQIVGALERYRSDKGSLPNPGGTKGFGLYGTDALGGPFPQTHLCAIRGPAATSPSNNMDYLPGNVLPLSPWAANGNFRQKNDIAYPAGTPFVQAAAVAGGAAVKPLPPPPLLTTLVAAVGTIPEGTAAVYTSSFFGAVLYDVNAGLDIYVVAGVGKRGSAAHIVEFRSNAN